MARPYHNPYKDTIADPDPVPEPETPNPEAVEPQEPRDPGTEPVLSDNSAEATFAKRYADLRRHAQAQERQAVEKITNLERQVADLSKQAMQLPTSEDEVKRWVETYPDVARIVEAIAARKADERSAKVEERVKAAEDRERQAARREAISFLRQQHSDLDAIKVDPKFAKWASEQPEMIQQALFDSLDWRACSRALDLYKRDLGTDAPKRGPGRPRKDEAAAAASEAVTVGGSRPNPTHNDGKPRYKESEIARMSARQYEAVEADIIQARREGRLIYDLSDAAAT
jgi:hypothetical protein